MNEHAAQRERIARWLARRIAEKKGLAETEVGWSQPFSEFGLASLDLVALAMELGVWLGQEVETTLLFNRPDVEQVAAALTEDTPGEQRSFVARQEPVAIVGLACRFPGAPDAEAFWKLLQAGGDAIREVPAWRWGAEYFEAGEPVPGKTYTQCAGFVDGIDEFDAAFFGISAREAQVMDPQHRLLLMTVWHALEDAGIPPARLAGTRTGVFVGIGVSDYYGLLEQANIRRDVYFATGIAPGIAANRVSYLLDLRGPSMAVDTTCSSSLVALHQARASLLAGESDCAIVGGVNVIACPGGMVALSQGRMLSPTGRCHTFDEKADGYVRGEGCGVVVLKRFSDALRDGDRIHAMLAATAVNQDGKSVGLTVPNGDAQARLMRDALAVAGLEPGRVGYLEAHGTGTPLGDPIEMGAIKQVYGAPSEDESALRLGSVKTNVGHLEAAAGMAGLLKVVLAMRHQEIPPHRNFATLNAHISLQGTRCEIVTESSGWPMSLRPRYAAVSSFGIGGTNAHMIVQDAPATEFLLQPADDAGVAQLLVLSAKSDEALAERAAHVARFLREKPDVSWAAICHTAAVHRAHHPHRLAVVAGASVEAAEQLERFGAGGVTAGTTGARRQARVAFLFTGQGSQKVDMGRGLYRGHAGFARVMQRCDEVLQPLLGRSLLDMLYPIGEPAFDLAQTEHAQPALFALEAALATVWREAGVQPDVLMGHSLGEYVAAWLADVFSLEDALALVAQRARLMQECAPPGAMAAVQGAPELIEHLLREFEAARHARLAIAARNTPQEIVVSGELAPLLALMAEWTKGGAAVTPLHVTRAFHSPLMSEMAVEFERVARALSYRAPRIPVVSNLTGRLVDEEMACADYWVRHTLAPVRFDAGLEALAAFGCTSFIEMGPHPVLSAYVKQALPQAQAIASLRRGRDDERTLLEALGTWHVNGGAVDWRGWAQARSGHAAPPALASLPPYPFRRERHWFAEGAVVTRRDEPPPAVAEDAAVSALRQLPQLTVDTVSPLVEDFLFRSMAAVMRMSATQQAAVRPVFAAQRLNALGLDSLMGVELRQALQRELGVQVPMRRLLDGTTVDELTRGIAVELAQAVPVAAALGFPSAVSHSTQRYEPFDLSAFGLANWKAAHAPPGERLPNDLYFEIDVQEDVERFDASWQRLVERHDMLRAVVQRDGRLCVFPEVPPYRTAVADLSSLDEAAAQAAMQRTRAEMTTSVLDTERWPLFDIRASQRGGGRLRLHMSFSVLIVDAQSLGVLAADREHFYRDPAAVLPPPSLTYRDYCETVGELKRTHPAFEQARAHWRARGAELLPPPIAHASGPVRYASLRAELPAAAWTGLKQRAAQHGLTPSSALMAAYAVVLGAWSDSECFSIGVVVGSRLPLHPDVDSVVGDFSGLCPLAVRARASVGFVAHACMLQGQLADDLEHVHGSASALAAGPLPFLFNSMLHAGGDAAVVWSLTRGAATRIEMQSTEAGGALAFNWDVQLSSFRTGEPQAHFDALQALLQRLSNEDEAWASAHAPVGEGA